MSQHFVGFLLRLPMTIIISVFVVMMLVRLNGICHHCVSRLGTRIHCIFHRVVCGGVCSDDRQHMHFILLVQ